MRKLYLLFVIASIAIAGTMNQTVVFSSRDLNFSEKDGYTIVNLNGALSRMETGYPSLPLVNLSILIPATAEIRSVEVTSSEKTILDGTYRIYPAQPPRPLLEGYELPFQEPDAAVYERDADYPGKLVEFVPSGSKSGYRIAGILAYPLQYNPKTGKLAFYTRLNLRIGYDEGARPAPTLTPAQAELFGPDVSSLVVNSDDLKRFAPVTRSLDGEKDYAIITPASLVSAWSPLLDLRRRQGLNAMVMPVETIYARYSGTDNPTKIRAFIQDYFTNHGLKWVLLGGDHGLVPTRYGYLPYSTYSIPADVYYADLDWSWDSNHNGQYGEMTGDTLDLFGDVYIGRIPCDNATHVATFIAKDTTYELHPDTTYLKRILLPWEWLWQNIGHGGFLTNNNIKTIMPADWQASVVDNSTQSQTVDSLNRGQHFMHFAGHGNYDVFGSALSISNVPSLTNMASRKLAIINSMACFCGEFDDQECLAEALMNAANGGSVAAMLNARYGWGAPPNMGPGEHFSQEFYRRWAQYREVGKASGLVKDYFRNVSMSQMTYRWTTYVLTSFGDPAMPMWTHKPGTLTAVFPESVPAAPQMVRVTLTADDAPVTNAMVSWLNHNTVVAAGKTNSQGWVELFLNPAAGDTLQLWTSCRDFLPFSGTTLVQAASTAPSVALQSTRVQDLGNGRLDPGETADLFVTLANNGNATATAVAGTLYTSSPFVTILDSVADYGSILPGDTSRGDRYQVMVSSDCPNGTRAEFWVHALSPEGDWQPFFELPIGQPPLQGAFWATHDTGNFILSVTGLGSIGSTAWRAEGIGLVWPKAFAWSASRLMLASLVLGTDTGYVCDRFYRPNYPACDSDFRMKDSVRPVIPPDRADEEFLTVFDDSPHRNSKHLEISQKSMVLARTGLNDFCVIEYTIANNDTTLSGPLAVGLFADFKMTGWNVNDSFDVAAAESAYRLAYVNSGDTATLGVRLLYPTELRGISVIDGYNYIQRSGMMNSAAKDSFLWGKKVVMSGPAAKNWAVMVSAGPFLIPPGWQQRVAFAIVGGHGRTQIRANSDSAQNWYDQNSGIAEVPVSRMPHTPFGVSTIFSDAVTITYSLPADRHLAIDAFDASGRLVEHVFNGDVSAPGRIAWQPKNLERGIYFLNANGRVLKVVRVE